jgi:hypothetical protein
MITDTVAANAPLLAVAATRVHHHTQSVGFPGLPAVLLLAIVVAVVGVSRTRRRSRTKRHEQERSDDWPPRPSRGGPTEQRDVPPWQ